MELSRDPPHGWGSPWKRFLLIAILLSFWAQTESAQIFIATVPNLPLEGDDVILIALNAPDRILNASWYSGFQPSDPDMITSCIPTAQAGPCAQRLGPAHTRREALTNWNTLEIRNLTLSDIGFYSLVLNTDSGLEKASTYIHVWHQQEFVLIPDISVNMNVAVENVDSVVFTCHTNETNVKVLWYNGGWLLQGGGRLQLSNGNRTLAIRPVTRDDQGLYFCRVWNESDYQTSETIQLTVLYGPGSVVTSSYPELYEGTVVSDLNYSVVLHCSAMANPSPLITWSLNGNVCGTQDTYVIRRLAKEDLGNYTCTAQNSVGLRTSNPVHVQLPEPPSEDTDTEPREPDSIYAFSGAPAIILTIAGTSGIVIFIGVITSSVINRKALMKGRNSKCGCF